MDTKARHVGDVYRPKSKVLKKKNGIITAYEIYGKRYVLDHSHNTKNQNKILERKGNMC